MSAENQAKLNAILAQLDAAQKECAAIIADPQTNPFERTSVMITRDALRNAIYMMGGKPS